MLSVKTEKFEGPLDLLLRLIEKEELDITKISLAKIADEYIDFVQSAPEIKPSELADFLVVAARLLYIKSKAMFPSAMEEEAEPDDLEKQLKMYREFLAAAKNVEAILKKNTFMFARQWNRQAVLESVGNFTPPKKLSKEILSGVFKEIIERIKPEEEKLDEKLIERTIHIEDRIKLIKELLLEKIKFNFRRLLEKADSKNEVIVSFLAMLELAKQRDIIIVQEELFGEIEISKFALSE